MSRFPPICRTYRKCDRISRSTTNRSADWTAASACCWTPCARRIFASHGFHEIQQYYPMRALRTRQYKYIVNLAAALNFPIAGDIQSSPSWRAIEARPAVGLGGRTLEAFLHRPAEELYDLTKDRHELRNVATDPAYRDVLERMRADMAEFRATTHDPWLPGQSSAFGHESHPSRPP